VQFRKPYLLVLLSFENLRLLQDCFHPVDLGTANCGAVRRKKRRTTKKTHANLYYSGGLGNHQTVIKEACDCL
jgi:hypothetical protein